MSRIGPGYDWGQRSPRWAGITSHVIDVGGIRVHHLRAGVDGDGPTHLLIHPMGAGAWTWMDVIGPLSARGLVIAPDLPGSGRTRPLERGGDAFADARFLDAFTAALALERVVVHGHSLGGLVGGLYAGTVPDRVDRLILTSAPLPGLPDPPRFPAVLRVGLDVARPVADVLVGAGIRLKADALQRWLEEGNTAKLGPELSRISPELLALLAEEVGRVKLSWRVQGAVDAASSALRALTVDEAKARATLDAIAAPVVLLWGADDRVIPERLVRDVEAAHPAWRSRTIDGVGHVLPWEAPETYVELATEP